MRIQIKNYPNYWIDDQGEVYNETTKKILTGSIGENGYKYYRLTKNGKKKMFYAHRLVAEAFLENTKNLPVVNHKDGNKLNNTVDNLEWVSYSDNAKHWHKNIDSGTRTQTNYYQEDLEQEEWKKFQNYLVSSYGRIRHATKNNLLHPSIASGYYKVRLSNNGLVSDYMVHKLVYQLFNDDYDDTKIIDHIDGNKLNNHKDNLRQVTVSENVMAAYYKTKTNTSTKIVEQYDLQGNLLNTFPSTKEAARVLGLDASAISKVCRGVKYKTHGGFVFKYKE